MRIIELMDGWNIYSLLGLIEPVPSSIAQSIPWSILFLLLVLAIYYAYVTFLEQRRRKDIHAIVERYHHSQSSRSVFLNITSHYINTPIAMMQGTLQLMYKNKEVNEEAYVAINNQLDKLAQDTQRVFKQAQYIPEQENVAIKQLENIKLPKLLSKPSIWLPIMLLISLAIITNYIFISAKKYPPNAVNIGAQIGIAQIGIAAVITSYYYVRKTRNNREIVVSQLKLEKYYASQQVNFIQQAYSALNEDITALSMVSKPIIGLPRGNVFKEGLTRLFHSITELARLQQIAKLESKLDWITNVNNVANNALSGIRELSDKAGVGIIVNIDPYLSANIDETSLYHLIESTLDNAIKFSPMGSQIYLTIRQNKNVIIITVKDNGQGISKELQHNLLTPFTRDSIEQFEYNGMGLDLYLCRLILDHYNGNIKIVSAPGKGTAVQMMIPIANDSEK